MLIPEHFRWMQNSIISKYKKSEILEAVDYLKKEFIKTRILKRTDIDQKIKLKLLHQIPNETKLENNAYRILITIAVANTWTDILFNIGKFGKDEID